jgi:hypothetical protein
MKYTPMVKSGKAEFFFVANDPTEAVISHLIEREYPFIVNWEPLKTHIFVKKS